MCTCTCMCVPFYLGNERCNAQIDYIQWPHQLIFCLMLSRAASEFCKLSGLLCSYGLYQVVLSEQLCLYCRGNTSEFSARLVLVDQETGASEFVIYCSVPGKHPLRSRVSAHVCTSFQGVNVAVSIQMYGSYILGKRLDIILCRCTASYFSACNC